MVVQAGAAEQVVRDDPERAAHALRAVQDTGRSAIDDLRRMLGLLRGQSDGDPLAPQPGLGALDDLVASHRDAGATVELERGQLPALEPGLDLAAYRIVQEALTNAAKHATGRPTRVRIHAGDGQLDIVARTSGPVADGRAVGTGTGLFGRRERARLYGGRVSAGPEGGDWVVRASIPVRGR
jgi:signal transduction histidine kinase